MYILAFTLLFLLLFAPTACGELAHSPHGNNNLYDSHEVEQILWERSPRDPLEGERVTLYVAVTPIDREQTVALEWSLNGNQQEDIRCTRYMEKDGQAIFRAKLPAFAQGDGIEYRFVSNAETTERYHCTVLGWEDDKLYGVQRINKSTIRLVLTAANKHGSLPAPVKQIRYLTDGREDIHACEIVLSAMPDEQYLGFGMRYNAQDQRGHIVDHYTVNWYCDQQEKTYAPVPYYIANNRYGLCIDSDAYMRFDMGKSNPDEVRIYIDLSEAPETSAYLFFGDNAAISKGYADIAGHASPLPDWAYGVWLSANEWNKQKEAEEQLALATEHGIDVSVLVLEAWSDEETFYRFSEQFSNPKALVDKAHAQGARVLLWQIPVLKQSQTPNAYSIADERYAIQNRFVIMNGDGTPYRMPNGWFGGSLLVDFSNPEAEEWFLEKRRSLIDEIGVDGFKTDGGEFIWGKNVLSASGLSGRALRNAYPDLYALSYQETLDTLTFSRAGGRLSNQHTLLWAGDQKSTFDEFRACIRALLNTNVSGMPFVAFDIAGFSGELPTSELYQRAVAFAAFTPIMQVHSEISGDPVPSQARTPWNMAAVKRDDACLTTFQKYAKVNADFQPYMREQAALCRESGKPLLRMMAYAFPEDEQARLIDYQFMLGEKYLVAPVTKAGVSEWNVYLPHGIWRNYWTGEQITGGQWVVCSAQLGEIPVYEYIERAST